MSFATWHELYQSDLQSAVAVTIVPLLFLLYLAWTERTAAAGVVGGGRPLHAGLGCPSPAYAAGMASPDRANTSIVTAAKDCMPRSTRVPRPVTPIGYPADISRSSTNFSNTESVRLVWTSIERALTCFATRARDHRSGSQRLGNDTRMRRSDLQ